MRGYEGMEIGVRGYGNWGTRVRGYEGMEIGVRVGHRYLGYKGVRGFWGTRVLEGSVVQGC